MLVLANAFARTASSFVKLQSWQAVLRYGTGSLGPGRRAEFHALLRFAAGFDLAASAAGGLACAAAAWALRLRFLATLAYVPSALVGPGRPARLRARRGGDGGGAFGLGSCWDPG